MRWNVLPRIVTATAALALLFSPGSPFAASVPTGVTAAGGTSAAEAAQDHSLAASLATATPIKHLVVLFQENESFDHYFGTYPNAANPRGEPVFTARGNTPAVNGLTPQLLTSNPNAAQPFRLDRSQALTCDQVHNYTPEEQAEDGGAMDKFVQNVQGKSTKPNQYCPNGIVMGYYDGNTVTALWNYAQHFAMSDNAFGTVFGPSTPGALNLVAADTGGTSCGPKASVYNTPGTCSATSPPPTAGGTGTTYRDTDPYYDDCAAGGTADKSKTAAMTGPTIAGPLNTAKVTWGWFEGGFTDCNAKHPLAAVDRLLGIDPATDPNTFSDYDPHHEPFQYFASTANPHHLAPSSNAMIGQTDQANHQYDLTSFWTAADAGNLPAVSFLKAPGYQDGHPANSDPLDEQEFLVNSINHLMSLPSWSSTAVIIQWDDSDGWYDHVRGPIVNHSSTPLDVGCGTTTDGLGARCGYGPRLPYLVISPYTKDNFVDHTLIDQTSTTRFIEDNWLGGTRISSESFDNKAGSILGMFDFNHPSGRRLLLDPQTGTEQNTVTVMAVGDIACDPANPDFHGGNGDAKFCQEKATSDLVAQEHPDAVLALGDNQYEDAALPAFAQSYDPTWGRFKAITYPVPGNHEYQTPGAEGYFAYFGARAGNAPGGYYSFTLGAWHIIALNSECTDPRVVDCSVGSPQEQWLLSDLAANRNQCTLAFWHEPRFTSGRNLNHPAVQPFWDDLYAFGATIVLNGHDHIYERFAPQNPAEQADPNGIREFIVGTGGNNHQPNYGAIQPTSEVRDKTTYGVMKLTLSPDSYAWQFIPAKQTGNGTFTDKGSGTCHGINAGTENGSGPRAVPVVTATKNSLVARFTVDYTSAQPGKGEVLFGSGPGCTGLVQIALGDRGEGTTHHWFVVTGNDLPGTVGDIGITPGATYSYETVTVTKSGTEVDNNGGKCYTVTIV